MVHSCGIHFYAFFVVFISKHFLCRKLQNWYSFLQQRAVEFVFIFRCISMQKSVELVFSFNAFLCRKMQNWYSFLNSFLCRRLQNWNSFLVIEQWFHSFEIALWGIGGQRELPLLHQCRIPGSQHTSVHRCIQRDTMLEWNLYVETDHCSSIVSAQFLSIWRFSQRTTFARFPSTFDGRRG